MPSENIKFGGGLTATTLHPVTLIVMLALIAFMLLLRRQYVIVPLLVGAILIPLTQQLIVGGLHLMMLRILILVGCIRMFATKFSAQEPIFTGGVNLLDKAFLCWAFFRSVTVLFLFWGMPAFINTLGFDWDVFGGYLLLRFLVRDEEDVYRVIKASSWIALILAACMLNEQWHDQNIFGFLGGMPITPQFREGLIRAQGPFAIPITAGTFGATLLPLFLMLWKSKKAKVAAVVGVTSSFIVAISAASSTSLLGFGGGALAVCFWPLRKKMRLIRWGIAIGLVSLHLIMKAPVWFLITHIDIFGGNSNYHRAALIDMFIRHFTDWWLVGVKDTGVWGWDMWDLANQFVAEGESGGLGAFTCFVAMICICFSWIGKARKAVEGDRKREWIFWLLGAALFSNVIVFFGISYFDQTRFYWFTFLAMVPAATAKVLAEEKVPERESGLLLTRPFKDRTPYPNQPHREWQRNSPLLHRQSSR